MHANKQLVNRKKLDPKLKCCRK